MKELSETITERRRLTRNSIYNLIYDAEIPPTKLEIAQKLELSLPTVHQNIAELIAAGLIVAGETQKSTGGRRPVSYSVVTDIRFAVGISITADHLRFLATDLRLKELAYRKIKTTSLKSTEIAIRMATELEAFLNDFQLDRHKMLGVGITVPAVLDEEKDQILLSPTLQMRNISLRTIRDHIPYPTYMENDGNAGGFAEWFPLRKEKKDIAYLYIENGVGGAVFINGEPYLGANRRSGEFGHMCVENNGLVCKCGKRGCLEAYISARRITTDLGVEPETFFAELEKGNENYHELWEDMLQHLAIGLANIRMAFDCDIIIGGFLTQFMEPYTEEIKERVASNDPFEEKADYIRLCKFPKRADMMGVAWHFIKEFTEKI